MENCVIQGGEKGDTGKSGKSLSLSPGVQREEGEDNATSEINVTRRDRSKLIEIAEA